jgi:hypothetical protein
MLRYAEITDPTYESYKEPYTIAIPLDQPLRSIGNVRDELTCIDGKYGIIRRIKYTQLTSVSNKNDAANANDWMYYQRLSDVAPNLTAISILSDMLTAKNVTELQNGKTIEHWDVQTPDFLVYSKKTALGWQTERYANPTGKINVIYYQQRKAWDGAEQRLHREEMLDSKIGDTNNYFADPIAAATGDVITSMADPERPGKLIQLAGGDSKFEYINPPQNSESQRQEKIELEKSILFDTFTPDLSFENLKGMGTLSGTAIKNAMILGFIKRDNMREIYDEMLDREKNVILGILKYLYPNKAAAFDSLVVSHEFSEPFAIDRQGETAEVASLYQAGLMSLETAIQKLGLTDSPEEEIARLQATLPQIEPKN